MVKKAPFYEFENRSPVVDPKAFVHPVAVLIGDVKVDVKCYVGAGSFVLFKAEIPSHSVVLGSRARVVKEMSQPQLKQIKYGLSIYQDLTRRYLKSFNPIDVPASACSEGKVQMKKAEISG